jgi:predicted RNase H-related nuclease YkuK (DUF458 family)
MSENYYKVFISHGKPDTFVAKSIARSAQDCGATTFLDETDIKKGDNFKQIVHREIAQSKELIALLTPESAQRFWVWVEIGAAWGQEKRIIAVLYGITTTKLEELGGSKAILEDINIVDINGLDSYWDELRKRVADHCDA